MNTDHALRSHLLSQLNGGNAHMSFEDVVANFPPELFNTNPPNVSYTPWHLIEHMRITQWDILEYIRNPEHISPDWPVGYWPERTATTDAIGWHKTIDQFLTDLQALRNITNDPNTYLFTPIPHGHDGHTVLREILVVVDHNAYHIGELGILRQVMKAWR